MGSLVKGEHYWVAFSSYRNYGFQINGANALDFIPQIWLAAIDPEALAQGEDPSFSPVWLPNQDLDGGNHIAQWADRAE